MSEQEKIKTETIESNLGHTLEDLYDDAFEDGANWQKEQFEEERLKSCDELTEEEYNLESEFVVNHIEKNNRTPTFCDAIEYGMKLQKEKMIDKACEWWTKYLVEYLQFDKQIIEDFRKAMEGKK